MPAPNTRPPEGRTGAVVGEVDRCRRPATHDRPTPLVGSHRTSGWWTTASHGLQAVAGQGGVDPRQAVDEWLKD
jgi:hypothetical protein